MRSLTWTDADGATTILDGSAGILALADPVGLDAPDPANTVDPLVGFDGGILVNRRRPVRSIALGLLLEHPTRIETAVELAARIFQGPGALAWADEVHTRTLRQVVYETGLGGGDTGNLVQRVVVLSLIALDPWWYGEAVSLNISSGVATAFDAAIAFSGATPFDGGGPITTETPGDTDAWPIFTITGPATTLSLSAGGLSWAIAAPLAAGSTLVIDHRPTSRGPRLNGGPVDWSLLTPASRLWPLAQGGAAVTATATGMTGASAVEMAYESRWLTP